MAGNWTSFFIGAAHAEHLRLYYTHSHLLSPDPPLDPLPRSPPPLSAALKVHRRQNSIPEHPTAALPSLRAFER
jgi:hypothetical protein